MADKQQATTPAKEHVIEEDDEFEEFENEGTWQSLALIAFSWGQFLTL
jgi:hypothetical protein